MNLTRYWLTAMLTLWLSAGLQQGAAPLMGILEVQPNLILISVTILGLIGGSGNGAVYGLLGGIFHSAIVSKQAIFYQLVYVLVGAAAGLFKESKMKVSPLTSAFLVVVSSLIVGFLGELMAGRVGIVLLLKATIFSAMYNGVLALIVHWPVEKAIGRHSQSI
jgi:hypothetical protein